MIRRTEFEALRRKVEASTVKKGVGYKLRRTSGGTVLDILPGKGGASSTHPFKIFIEPKPVTGSQEPGDNGYQGYVTDGTLFQSLRPDDYTPITGLTMPDDETPSYFDVLPNDAIYLETSYDEQGEITGTIVQTWGEGGTFDPTLNPWLPNAFVEGVNAVTPLNPNGLLIQSKSRLILGYTIAGESGAPELKQEVKSNLILRECVINGVASRYPITHVGSYYLGGE